MDPITIALGLAQVVPGLIRWISGDDSSKAAQVADQVIGVAKTVTGKASGDDALAAIKADPALAAEIYARADKPKLSPEQVRELIVNPENSYSTSPHNILKYADFMSKIGLNRNRAASWRDLFFAETSEGN